MTYGTQTYGTTTYGSGSSAQVLVAHPTLWRIAAGNGMHQTFDAIAPGEIHVFAFDLTADITPGDYLVGTPQISITLASGLDAALAGFVQVGSPQLSGNLLLVEATATQAGAYCNYYLAAACLTAQGQVLSLGGRVSVTPAALQ